MATVHEAVKQETLYIQLCSLLKGKESKTKIFCEKLQSKIAANHCVNISKAVGILKNVFCFGGTCRYLKTVFCFDGDGEQILGKGQLVKTNLK